MRNARKFSPVFALFQPLLQVCFERSRVIMLLVPRAVNQGYVTAVRRFKEWFYCFRAAVQLREIPLAEFLPALWVVMELLAQIV